MFRRPLLAMVIACVLSCAVLGQEYGLTERPYAAYPGPEMLYGMEQLQKQQNLWQWQYGNYLENQRAQHEWYLATQSPVAQKAQWDLYQARQNAEALQQQQSVMRQRTDAEALKFLGDLPEDKLARFQHHALTQRKDTEREFAKWHPDQDYGSYLAAYDWVRRNGQNGPLRIPPYDPAREEKNGSKPQKLQWAHEDAEETQKAAEQDRYLKRIDTHIENYHAQKLKAWAANPANSGKDYVPDDAAAFKYATEQVEREKAYLQQQKDAETQHFFDGWKPELRAGFTKHAINERPYTEEEFNQAHPDQDYKDYLRARDYVRRNRENLAPLAGRKPIPPPPDGSGFHAVQPAGTPTPPPDGSRAIPVGAAVTPPPVRPWGANDPIATQTSAGGKVQQQGVAQ